MAPRAVAATKVTRKRKSAGISTVDVEDLMPWADDTLQEARASLLAWYDGNHRVLPWRRNPHSLLPANALQGSAPLDVPEQQFIYWVWVCEVMSQQTQIDRVKEYWQRWIAKWPTVKDLAVADEEAVNQMWAGLGYYRRARFLLQGARHVCDALGGVFPTTSSELQTIPGVGAYTGNAIASIACGQPVAVMDANVIRVVSRLFTITGDPGQREVLDKMNAVAGKLLDPGRPGDYNQAMMELGAVVCLGNGAEPKCTTCPLQHHCGAYKAVQDYVHKGGHKDDAAAPLVTRYPEKPAKKDKREEHVAVCVVQHREDAATAIELHSYLLAKRPEQGLLAGLWEFPSVAVDADANENARKAALDKLLQGTLGLEHALSQWRVVHRRAIGSTVHVFSHIRMTLHVEHLLVDGPVGDEKKHQDASTASHTMWVTHASLSNGTHKLSGAPSKVFNMINDKQNGGGKSAPENNTTITSFFKPS